MTRVGIVGGDGVTDSKVVKAFHIKASRSRIYGPGDGLEYQVATGT